METQEVSMSLLTKKVFQIHLANNMLPKTWNMVVPQSTSARTAPGLHAQLVKIAKINVGLSTTKNIMLPTIILSLVPPRLRLKLLLTDPSLVVLKLLKIS